MKETTERYPHLDRFIEERCRREYNAYAPSAELNAAYERWCRENGIQPLSNHKLKKALPAAGFPYKRKGTTRAFVGIELAK